MKTMLNQILRNLMRRSSEIGTVHTGTKLVDTVRPNTSTLVSSVMVPPGTYMVTGNVEWPISSNAFTVALIRTEAGSLAIDRGSMNAGGGHSLSVIVTLSGETKLSIEVYHAHAESVGVREKLQAVRIK